MEQFCSIFAVWVKIWPPYVNESKSLRRVSGQGPLICHKFRSSQRWWHFSPLSRLWSNLAQFSLLESKFDHLIPYVNESKSLRRVSGQDPLICHMFQSSQRWWYFRPLSRLGPEYGAIFAVWDQIWPPYTLCKWKQIIEKSFWTGPFNLPRFRSSQRWWHFSPLSRLGPENGAILLNFRCLSPNLTTLYLM